MDIPHTKHTLANGLDVVLHPDRSAPLVSVYVYYHVGSSREDVQRSGFAHLFEHMLFQGSQNVPEGDHFRLIQTAGGSLNGTTNQDRTNYFETLPSNYLDLALWLESDRMGFLLPAMTQAKLDNQRDVVKNERRQSYENRPYGLVHETLLAQLFPATHPYSWPTIGSMEHIERVTLEDVADFFRRWYGPNNATLVVAGDFEEGACLQRVEHWFAKLPRGPRVDRPAPWPAPLCTSRRAMLEDDVNLSQLTLAWPSVEAWHPDEPALNLLTEVLSANRSSILDRHLMIEEQLASYVTIQHGAGELAGVLYLNLRPHHGVALDRLERRVDELIARVAQGEVSEERLRILKSRSEGARVRALETAASKASLLGHYNCFHGDPNRLAADLARHDAVRVEDVVRVARRYLHERPRLALSVVPRGCAAEAAGTDHPSRRPLPVAPERGAQPAAGALPGFRLPEIAHAPQGFGLRVCATQHGRLPLTRLLIAADAGRLREPRGGAGLARLTADMLNEGAAAFDGNALVDRLDALGATLEIDATDDEIVLELGALDRCLDQAVDLVRELLVTPRFDEQDFERLRKERLVELSTRGDRSTLLASDLFARLVYGAEHQKGTPLVGTAPSVEALTCADVRAHWATHAGAQTARVAVVGARGLSEWCDALGPLRRDWNGSGASGPPGSPQGVQAGASAAGDDGLARSTCVYLIDKPGAAQSELRVGHLGVARDHPDFFKLFTLNYLLGGAFSSRINLNLREDKGYTYGARSAFGGGRTRGLFTLSTAVKTVDTAPALREIMHELRNILEGVTDAEVSFARQSLTRMLLRSYETMSARLGFLDAVAKYGFAQDYPLERMAWLQGMQAEELSELARRFLHPENAYIAVVGDRAAILSGLEGLGLGEVTTLAPEEASLQSVP